jgi:hypothetical protein
MPDLYIANCTRQKQVVYFRKDFTAQGQPEIAFRPATQREIEPGQQVKVLAGEHISLVDSVVEQLRVYGLTAVADIPRAASFVPSIFNVDRMVTKSQILTVMDHNSRVKLIEGKERRQKAAVASNDLVTETVARDLARQGLPAEAIPDTVQTSVEFEQVDQSEAGENRIEEGIRVRTDAPDAPRQKKSGRNARRKA